jgi:hypothetical protein
VDSVAGLHWAIVRVRITSFSIRDFQQFRELDLDFTHPNTKEPLDRVCFVGPNGTGKSTLLQLLRQIIRPQPYTTYFPRGDAVNWAARVVGAEGSARWVIGQDSSTTSAWLDDTAALGDFFGAAGPPLHRRLQGQRGFCAYSERYVRETDAADVEHFDPRLKGHAEDGYRNRYATLAWMNRHKPRDIHRFLPILPPDSDLALRIKYQSGLFAPSIRKTSRPET